MPAKAKKGRTIHLKKVARTVFYIPTSKENYKRGWWVREYHSTFAMEQHLKGKKGWERSYTDAGPFRSEQEARDW
jgi:hypothetical protein